MGDGDGRAERFAALATQAKLSPALAADATALLDELTPSLAAYNESEEGLQPLVRAAGARACVALRQRTHCLP